jgi:hypothetical protein
LQAIEYIEDRNRGIAIAALTGLGAVQQNDVVEPIARVGQWDIDESGPRQSNPLRVKGLPAVPCVEPHRNDAALLVERRIARFERHAAGDPMFTCQGPVAQCACGDRDVPALRLEGGIWRRVGDGALVVMYAGGPLPPVLVRESQHVLVVVARRIVAG